MKTHRFLWMVFVFTFALQVLLLTGAARAQDQQDQDDEDPPSRVARLNYSSGSVSFQPGGEGEWISASGNRPLTTGDNLWADQNSRAEFHVGSLAVRMNSETSMTFLDLDDRTTQLRLSMGSVILRVRHLDDGDLLEVDTPNVAFTIQRTGEYRVDVNEDGTRTITTVWHGRAEATGGGYSYTVVAGQEATFTGTDQLDHEIAQIHPSDDFDNFAFQRDARDDHDESSNYISSEMTGYEDLDDYGRWHYAADYGPVWTPNGIAADWAPYRYGHWVWVAPWGWTWVEDEPWGFAPFHYGRWAFVDSSWCWVPGPVVVRPVYAPALVAFVGGGGFHLSIGVGEGMAWFPLGPREVYVPPYRVSRRYVDNVNITNTRVNVTQVTNVYNTYITNNNTSVTRIAYVNQRNPRAVTAVSRDTFVNARPVNRNLAQVNARELEQAPVTHTLAAQPARQSVLGAGAPARVKPPAAVENRRVIATRNPTPPRAPLEQRQQQAANVKTEPMRPSAPAEPTRPNNAARPGEPANNARGNEPGRPNQPARPNEPARSNEPPRPNEPNRANEPNRSNEPNNNPERSNAPERGNEPARPNQPANVPRPNAPAPRPEQPDRGAQPARPEAPRPEQNAPRPNAPDRQQQPDRQQPERPEANRQDIPRPQHPLVRQAPPVQQREQTEQSEANKFRTWQQQRPPRPQQQERQAQPERPQQQRQNASRPPENRPQHDQRQDKKPQ